MPAKNISSQQRTGLVLVCVWKLGAVLCTLVLDRVVVQKLPTFWHCSTIWQGAHYLCFHLSADYFLIYTYLLKGSSFDFLVSPGVKDSSLVPRPLQDLLDSPADLWRHYCFPKFSLKGSSLLYVHDYSGLPGCKMTSHCLQLLRPQYVGPFSSHQFSPKGSSLLCEHDCSHCLKDLS